MKFQATDSDDERGVWCCQTVKVQRSMNWKPGNAVDATVRVLDLRSTLQTFSRSGARSAGSAGRDTLTKQPQTCAAVALHR